MGTSEENLGRCGKILQKNGGLRHVTHEVLMTPQGIKQWHPMTHTM
jgi:hypothetical protein